MKTRERMLGGLWGGIVGDALGVPIEFKSRSECQRNPVIGPRGYGTHNQPPGTWSDDSSLLLCTVASLNECNGLALQDLSQRFLAWLDRGYMTPWGKVFDVGNATRSALGRLRAGVSPTIAGGADENSNGNGSLMRILPIALYFAKASQSELLEAAHQASAVTHRHARSQIACGIYCLFAAELLRDKSPADAYAGAIVAANDYYSSQPSFVSELNHFARFLVGDIGRVSENEISSSGYVISTLEASVWCLLTTKSYTEAVLRAVNLGGDTDTTGIVTGGLAGIHYGIDKVPIEWRDGLARKADITTLLNTFADQSSAKFALEHK